jgi:hypothetical protein
MITTTINMSPVTRSAVADLARRLEVCQRDVVIALLMRLMRDVDRRLGGFTGVRCQPGLDEGEWHPFCICFKPDEYEFYTDLRKLCKLSVSYLVAIAAQEYMCELLGKNDKSIFNYIGFRNCALSTRQVEGIICWQYYWGKPPPAEKSIPRERLIRHTGPLRLN